MNGEDECQIALAWLVTMTSEDCFPIILRPYGSI